jgi:hypothetical protein
MIDRAKREGSCESDEKIFDRAMRALVRVPKSEVNEQERKEQEAKEKKPKKARA